MQKLFILLLSTLVFYTRSQAQVKTESPVQVKSMHIKIASAQTDAQTDIEIVLYNPNERILDGEFQFSLNKGQVVTGFTLDVNGHQRQGVITDKQKARVAYENTIRRRIDPGLLELTEGNNYRVRVYPVAPHATRTITISISQLLELSNHELRYSLPLRTPGSVEDFLLDIESPANLSSPISRSGIIESLKFSRNGDLHQLHLQQKMDEIKQGISFSVPLENGKSFTSMEDGCTDKRFIASVEPVLPVTGKISISSATIFWDVSTSSSNRNINKEIDLLEQYIFTNNIRSVTLVTFSNTIHLVKTWDIGNATLRDIKTFLRMQTADGGTQVGKLDCTKFNSDVFLLFSDGISNYGTDKMKLTSRPVYCINSAPGADFVMLNRIASESGGKYIDLVSADITTSLNALNQPLVKVLKIDGTKTTADLIATGNIANGELLITGKTKLDQDSILIIYGINGKEAGDQWVVIRKDELRSTDFFNKITMLNQLDMMQQAPVVTDESLQSFAKKFPVVTKATSFIVLDNLQDYINYDIVPPAELAEQYQQQVYVVNERKKQKEEAKKNEELQNLQQLVPYYNNRIRWWSKNEPLIDLASLEKKPVPSLAVAADDKNKEDENANSPRQQNVLANKGQPGVAVFGANNTLNEVVVTTAYGIKRSSRSVSSNAQVVGSEQLNTIRQTNINNALAGKVAGIQLRGVSSVALDGNNTIRLRGESSLGGSSAAIYVVDGTILPNANDINTDDIEDVTVLQGPSAAALFGQQGQNGAIVITTKRGRRPSVNNSNQPVRYKDLDDMDYLYELKSVPLNQRYDRYLEMKDTLGDRPSFYFDVAAYLYQVGKKTEAIRVLSNLMEISKEDHQLLRATGYVLEDWKQYDEAIAVYEKVLAMKEEEPQSYRDLALAHYKRGDYQQAVDLLYKIITKNWEQYEARYAGLRGIMLNEMNAIIAIHKDKIDLSGVNPAVIKALPVYLRITIDWNKDETDIDLHVIEPGGAECYYQNHETVNGGRISEDFTQGYGPEEYQAKNALGGKYKVLVNYFGDRYQKLKTPSFIRVSVFKNFGKPEQSFTSDCLMMDNQTGKVEIETVQF